MCFFEPVTERNVGPRAAELHLPARGAFTVHGASTLTRWDRGTFTATNGSIVSGKADRAVNRGSNTEQININKNSTAFLARLCAKRQMQPAVSGHLCAGMQSESSRLPSGGPGVKTFRPVHLDDPDGENQHRSSWCVCVCVCENKISVYVC